ncbi:hypothetical protein HYY74_01555 [Candidatus Woesearchaeota archaeon]|nr:hypothetical protein [Candidatus Woesearchaeota archaeon]
MRTCPKCGSANLVSEFRPDVGIKWKCRTCGFLGQAREQEVEKKFGGR